MIDLNIVNFLTIGIIALASWAAFKFAMNSFGVQFSWL